jgi:hypothetical protein
MYANKKIAALAGLAQPMEAQLAFQNKNGRIYYQNHRLYLIFYRDFVTILSL